MKQTLIRPDAKFGFCPGCGHGVVLKKLDRALIELGFPREKTVLVTDIGCVGLSDQYFETSAFHGLHGRSITYATGLKLAAPDLHVIVLMGDGGAGIGGTHLINAARRNIGITVLVFNNFNFGMTGGEHSVTTPHGARTVTTAQGNLEYPLDICRLAMVGKPAFVARSAVFDKGLDDLLIRALRIDGFALLDVWEFCTAHYVPRNQLNKKTMQELMQEYDMPLGVLAEHPEREEYRRSYQQLIDAAGEGSHEIASLEPRFESRTQKRVELVIAGGAGQKIKSSATCLGQAGIMSGLDATQKDDYPITIMSGHSVSELIFDRQDIMYTGIDKPDIMLILAPEGLAKVGKRLTVMDEQGVVICDDRLELPPCRAQVLRLDMVKAARRIDKFAVGTLGIAAMLAHTEILPLDAYREAMRLFRKPHIAEISLKAIEAGEALVRGVQV